MSLLARTFGQANDNEQADMFNTMARELYVCCKGGSAFETQVYNIARLLTKDGEALIMKLAGFIELRRKEIPE